MYLLNWRVTESPSFFFYSFLEGNISPQSTKCPDWWCVVLTPDPPTADCRGEERWKGEILLIGNLWLTHDLVKVTRVSRTAKIDSSIIPSEAESHTSPASQAACPQHPSSLSLLNAQVFFFFSKTCDHVAFPWFFFFYVVAKELN